MAPAGERSLGAAPFLRILAAQATFGFGWCLYLVQPKYLTQALGAGPREVGLVGAVAGFAAIATIAGLVRVIDKPGGRRVSFLVGTLVLALVSAGFMLVERLSPLVYVLQAGVAVSYGLTFNSAMAMVTDVAPRDRMGQAFGLQSASNLAMDAVSSTVAEAVADRLGWRSVFALGVVSSLAAFAVAMRLPHGTATSQAATPGERPPYRALWPVFATSALVGAAFMALFTFHQPYAIGLGATKVSSFFVGFTASALLMRLGFGTLGDRFGHKAAVLASLVLYAVVPVSMVWLSPSLLWVYGAGHGLAHGVTYPTLTALATERSPASTRGRVIALFSGSFSVGTSAGALAWGPIADSSGYPRVFLLAGLVVVAAIATLGLGMPSGRAGRGID